METFYYRESIKPIMRPSKVKSIYLVNQLKEEMHILISSLKNTLPNTNKLKNSEW